MKYAERETIVAKLPHESRVGYVWFCVGRCLTEARLHGLPLRQLEGLPQLSEAEEMLRGRAVDGIQPDPASLTSMLERLSTLEGPAPDGEHALYKVDVTLVHAARMLTKGILLLQEPDQKPSFVAGALEGAVMSAGAIYKDWKAARGHEVAIVDEALNRLDEWGDQAFSPEIFEGIPDWPRGELQPKYAAGQIKGTAPEWDE